MRYKSFIAAMAILAALVANSFAAEIVNLDANKPSTLSLGAGNVVNSWTNLGTAGGTFTPNVGAQPTLVPGPNGTNVINFTGAQVLKDTTTGAGSTTDLTAFVVTSVATNTGGYNAFVTGNQAGNNDYSTGFNIDQGSNSNNVNWSVTNVESTQGGGNGGQNLMTSAVNFNTYHILEVHYSSAAGQLYFDGTPEGSRGSNGAAIFLDELRVGSRNYGGAESGFLNGNVGAVQIYTGPLSSFQQNQVGYLLGQEFGITTAFAPEPSSSLLAALSLVGLFFVGRRAKAAGLKSAVPVAILAIFVAANMASASSLNLNFTSTAGFGATIKDSTGQGTGLTARLSGTGGSLATNDPNLVLNTGAGTLSVAATPADLNGQGNLGVGEFLGTSLSTLGYNGSPSENFSVSATFSNVQYANNYQQFGVFVGTASNDNLRAGPLNCCSDPSRSTYGVYNNGNDIGNLLGGLPHPNVGDTISLTLARTAGVFSYTQTDVTNPGLNGSFSFTGLTGANATVNSALNAAGNLTVGVYVGNPGENAAVTETLTNYSVTVATPEPGSLLMAAMAAAGMVGMVCVRRARQG